MLRSTFDVWDVDGRSVKRGGIRDIFGYLLAVCNHGDELGWVAILL